MPFTAAVLRALADGPLELEQVRPLLGSPSAATLRVQVRALTALDAVEKRRQGGFPGRVDYRLTPAGEDLTTVAERLAAWLAVGPAAAPLASPDARRTARVLAGAWRLGIVDALAEGPRSLTGLSTLVSSLSYPALERRLGAMRRSGLAAAPLHTRPATLAAARKLRLAAGPLLAAACWEARWRSGAQPAQARDLATLLMLGLPLVRLPKPLSGTCRFGVDDRLEVLASVERGVVRAVQGGPERSADARAEAGAEAWATAILEGCLAGVRRSGDVELADELLAAMYRSLHMK